MRHAVRMMSLCMALCLGACAAGPLIQQQSIEDVSVSADGQWLAWKRQRHPDQPEMVVEIADWQHKNVRTVDPGLDPDQLQWAADNRHLLFIGTPAGRDSQHLYSVDVTDASRPPIDLTPYPDKFRLFLVGAGRKDGTPLLVQINFVKPGSHFDLYELSPAGGTARLVDEGSPEIRSWLTSPDGRLVVRTVVSGMPPRTHLELLGIDGHWEPGAILPDALSTGDGDQFELLSYPSSDGVAWVETRGVYPRRRLQRMDLRSGRSIFSPQGPPDYGGGLIDPATDRPLLYVGALDEPALVVFDRALRDVLAELPIPPTAKPYNFDSDDGGRRLMVEYRTDRLERWIFLIDRDRKTADLLLHADLISRTLHSSTQRVAFAARDGLPLVGFLTEPARAPAGPHPLVVMANGGPGVPYRWFPDDMVLLLAEKGYSVLRVVYRGTRLYDSRQLDAGSGEWGGRMQSDVIDGACWAVAQGFADPRRMAVVGGSYGGYVAMEALVQTPQLFAGAVSLAGPSDIPGLMADLKAESYTDAEIDLGFYLGPDQALWRERSPLYHVERIERPLLAIQGERDDRVHPDQLRRMEAAMKAAGKDITVLYTNDTHEGLGTEGFAASMAEIMKFLDRRIGEGATPDGAAADILQYCPPR